MVATRFALLIAVSMAAVCRLTGLGDYIDNTTVLMRSVRLFAKCTLPGCTGARLLC